MLTESNVKRLVTKLTRMRGAALKLGQFMSIQGMLGGSIGGNLTVGRFQTHISCHPRLRLSSEECKIARIICQIGRWRYESNHLVFQIATYRKISK